jgi:outer membrane protein assembly factor BamB/outer membrane biosynthesis protein TonB
LDKEPPRGRAGATSLTARCHTLRPDRTSGWLTYFELTEEGLRAGHFLVVGPGVARQPEHLQAALRAGQAAVRYLKEVPAHAPPLTLLEATARILDHECGKTGIDLEFGCAVLEERELWLLTRGAVRLVLLAPEPGVPFGAERPHAVSVHAEERYFFGRVPESVEAATSAELRARLERGGGDGGLVLRLAVSDRLREVEPTAEGGETSFETVEVGKPPKPPEKREVVPAQVPPPAPVAPRPETPSAPKPATPTPKPSTPAPKPTPPPVQPPIVAKEPPAPILKEAPGPPSPKEEDLPRPVETRGLGFWLGIVAAVFALAALLLYLFLLRPGVRGAAPPSAPPKTAAGADSLHGALIPPGPLHVAWQNRFGQPVTSSPIVAGDRVVFGCRDGRVYALRCVDGSSLWSFTAPDGFGASPVQCGNLVVIGGYDGNVVALDLATGRARWSAATLGRIVAAAAADSTSVYVGSYDHRLYAIALDGGAVRWSRDLGGVQWAGPAAGGGEVIAAGLDGRITALDAASGQERWSRTLGGPLYSSPALGEGLVFVGTREGDLVALDARSGAISWKADAGGAVNGGVAYRDGWVVVGIESGDVIGIETKTARVAWRVKTHGEVRSRPVFSGDQVWVAGYDGRLRALDWRQGKEIASFLVGSSMVSSPAVSGNAVYIGALDGRFLSLQRGGAPS